VLIKLDFLLIVATVNLWVLELEKL